MTKIKTSVFIVALALGLAACDMQPPQQAPKNVQAEKAAAAAKSITFTDNAEIDNIKKRIEITSHPGALGFVILLNQSGQPIIYEGVKGKITSGSKRLTRPYDIKMIDCGQYHCQKDLASPSDEGTWGSSGEYVYYWNQNGEYRQWNGSYLYSDKPFRLKVEPLVINIQ